MPHIRTALRAYLFNVIFFKILSTIFNMQLLYIIAFNSGILIERKIGKVYNAIYDGWYTNCV